MKKIYTTLSLLLLLLQLSIAQTNYSFTATTGNYASINGTTASLTDVTGYGVQEEGYQNGIPIGFTFNYNGVNYTTIGVNANGFAYFGNITTVDEANNGYLNGLDNLLPTVRPILAPFWEDAKYTTPNEISYLTSGIAPNRVFTLQWNNMLIGYDFKNPEPTPAMNMQVKLYETTGIIEFVYAQIPGGLVGSVGSDASGGASIGLSAAGTGSNNYISLSNSGASPVSSSTTENSTIQTRPATNQLYRFTPTIVLPISFTNFKAERANDAVRIVWTTTTESNNKGFEIERSVDGKQFTSQGFIASKSAAGFSNSILQYNFNDAKALTIGNYYRLKQIDNDGKIYYSSIIFVKGVRLPVFTLSTLFPNPAKNNLAVAVQSPFTGNISLIVADVTGKIVSSNAVNIITGDNLINVNVATLPSGTYFIKAICSKGCKGVYKQFNKQ